MDVQTTGGWNRRQEQGEEVDFEALKLVKTNHDVNVKVGEKVKLEGLPGECNLMAVSNTWGIIAVGGNKDVRIHRLADFHRQLEESARDASPTAEPAVVIPLPGRPTWIRLASNDQTLVVSISGPLSVQLFRLQDVVSGNANPYHSVTSGLPEQIFDLLPNPASPTESEALARHVALVSAGGLFMLDVESGRIQQVVQDELTSGSWSPKGKQIICGQRSGKLVQYTPEGIAKAELPPPPELSEEFYPTSVEWIENDIFLVSYKNSSADEDEPLSVFTIHRSKASSEIVYHEFFDPLNTMGLSSRPGSHRFVAMLKQWGETTRHLSFLISGRSSEVGVMRMSLPQDQQAPAWETLMLEETARGVMPAGKSGVSEDAACIGLELDLTSNKPIVMGIVGGVEVSDLPPAPRLLAYTQEGVIVSFDLRYQEAGAYPHMVKPQDIGSAPPRTADTAMDASVTEPTPTPAEPAAQPAQKPAFGGFGSQSNAFGSSAFGKPATPSTPAAGFGQSAFGQSSSKGFGQSAFGQPVTPSSDAKSAFGQSSTPSFGFSGFGQQAGGATSEASGSTKPNPFGQSSTSSSAFGQSAFGAKSSPGAFGQTAFGQKPNSTPAAFGQSAFGSGQSSNKPSAFGAPAASPATQPSTSNASSSAFGQSAFGQKPSSTSDKPAFGQSSTPSAFGQSAFGQSSKPSAFGQTSAASPSAFGSSSTASTGGFAGFGQKPSGQTGSAFGSSAFGQGKPAASTSGASPFGSGGAVGSGSAFGSSSAFGQSAFGTKPASSPFGSTTTPKAAPVAPPLSSEFGLGGLDSALDAANPASTEPSSPPELPVGPARNTAAPAAAQSQTLPDSPVFGASKQLSGQNDEDDSPPSTPKPFAQTPAKPTQPTSTFIKPATAFGSTSNFGSFGQTPAKSASTTTPSATPNAFSKPVSTTPASGAFGSPSFGSTTFGQSSTPSAVSAFGRPAAPPPAVGNITGGFGGFAPKTSDSPSAFAGFAPKNADSPSVFETDSPSASGAFAPKKSDSPLVFAGFVPKKPDPPQNHNLFGGMGGKSAFSSMSPGASLFGGSPVKTPVELWTEKVAEVEQDPIESPSAASQSTVQADDGVGRGAENAASSTPLSPQVKEEPKSPEPEGQEAPAAEPKEKEAPTGPAADSTNSISPTPQVAPAQAGQRDDQQGEEADAVGRDTGSSPEIIHHEDADSEGEEAEDGQYAEDSQSDEHEEEDEQAEDEEEYDEEDEGEEEYGEDDDYEDEESYDEGEEEADEEESGPSPEDAISPPPIETAKEAPTSDTPSLFSRLAPPASKPSFQGKHTVRTSSPLGSQPPENADTATPPGTPPQPTPTVSSKDASNAAPPPFFGFDSNKTSDTAKPSSTAGPPPLFGSAPTLPALGLGKSPAQQADQKPPFSFGLGKPSAPPVSSTPAEKEPEKKPFSGFGFNSTQTSTSAPPAAANKLPFSFGTPAGSSTTPSSTPAKPPSLFGQPQPQARPAPSSTLIKPVQPSTPGTTPAPDLSKFATPARTPVKDSPQARDDGSRQMAAVMTRMVADLMSEVKTLREALGAHAEYHRGLEPKFNKVSVNDLDKHSDLPFSSLSDITQVIDQLTAEMTGVTQADKKTELRVLELQSKMVKTDMKIKQAERLVEAHDDATAAYHANSQDLSPTQQEERTSMRRRKQAAESRLDDLERTVERLKKAAAEGRPTVAKLHQSIDEVEAAIVDKQDLIEDLSMRVKSIRLSTPGSRRSVGYTPSARQHSDVRNKATSFAIPPEVVADVQRQLDQQDKNLSFTSDVARVTRAGSSSNTVRAGKLPMPGKVDISAYVRDDEKPAVSETEPEEEVKVASVDQRPVPGSVRTPQQPDDVKPEVADPSSTTASANTPSFPPAFNLTPGPTISSPSPAFGGIKLSLDPGDLSSSHSRSRTAVAGTRAHHAAPRLSASPSSEKSGPSPAISFFPPPTGQASPSDTANAKNSPKGFFSFSGFGQQ